VSGIAAAPFNAFYGAAKGAVMSLTRTLAVELSTFVSGTVIAVDGGSSVKPSCLDCDDLPLFLRSEQLRRRLIGGG
jgi:hypothetical protein